MRINGDRHQNLYGASGSNVLVQPLSLATCVGADSQRWARSNLLFIALKSKPEVRIIIVQSSGLSACASSQLWKYDALQARHTNIK
jgi:hypothetical protein